MGKADIVFSLIAKTIGMERQAGELRVLMDLYVDAVDEDLSEDLEGAALPQREARLQPGEPLPPVATEVK